MKSNRSFWMSAALSLLTVVAGASLWTGGTPPASAVVSTLSSSATGNVSGSVIGSPETVSFSGSVPIGAKRVSDPDFFTPDVVVLSIDLTGVTGTGQSTGKTYVVTNQEVIIRLLTATDNVVVTFPFVPSGSTLSMSPRIGAATMALNFSATGALTAAKVTVSNP
jgi:hypothetical protein